MTPLTDEQAEWYRTLFDPEPGRHRGWYDTRLNGIDTARVPGVTHWRRYPQVVRLSVRRGGDEPVTVLLTRPVAFGLIRDLLIAAWRPTRRKARP